VIARLSPREFFAGGQDAVDTRAMTNVTDQQFEDVLTQARDEGNLSRGRPARSSVCGSG